MYCTRSAHCYLGKATKSSEPRPISGSTLPRSVSLSTLEVSLAVQRTKVLDLGTCSICKEQIQHAIYCVDRDKPGRLVTLAADIAEGD